MNHWSIDAWRVIRLVASWVFLIAGVVGLVTLSYTVWPDPPEPPPLDVVNSAGEVVFSAEDMDLVDDEPGNINLGVFWTTKNGIVDEAEVARMGAAIEEVIPAAGDLRLAPGIPTRAFDPVDYAGSTSDTLADFPDRILGDDPIDALSACCSYAVRAAEAVSRAKATLDKANAAMRACQAWAPGPFRTYDGPARFCDFCMGTDGATLCYGCTEWRGSGDVADAGGDL